MTVIMHILVMFAVVLNIQGHRKPEKDNFDMHSKPIDLLQRLKLLNFQNIEIIRKYVKQHSIWDNSGKIALKNSIAVTCRQRTMKVKMSVKDRANELLNMMELMVSVLQQLKIDESRLPLEADEMTKDLRHMEFELRDIAESVYRKLVENNLGPLLAPYTSGHFPDHPIYNGYSPKTVRTMIVMQLYALQSCIGDIYHVLKNDLLDVLHGIKFRA
ncbi:uncharacterized protein LOC135695095 [Rhopilema esculentum]|uniref:uncharacterized protein LOC135695095 n=1 Tax=Rhopilema esculentum TaxID=499914 RepID=UPI0031D7A9BB